MYRATFYFEMNAFTPNCMIEYRHRYFHGSLGKTSAVKSRLYRLGVSQAQKAESGDDCGFIARSYEARA